MLPAFKARLTVIAENKKSNMERFEKRAAWFKKKKKGLWKASSKEVSMADVEISTTKTKPNFVYLNSKMP